MALVFPSYLWYSLAFPCPGLGSLQLSLEGVRMKGHGVEQIYVFKQIPRYRYDEKAGFFEFEFDKPDRGIGINRFRTNQAQKISETMGLLVDKLVKMRNAKK